MEEIIFNVILGIICFSFGIGFAKGWFGYRTKYLITTDYPMDKQDAKELQKFFGKNTMILHGQLNIKKVE
jgi:hypothetical protein